MSCTQGWEILYFFVLQLCRGRLGYVMGKIVSRAALTVERQNNIAKSLPLSQFLSHFERAELTRIDE